MTCVTHCWNEIAEYLDWGLFYSAALTKCEAIDCYNEVNNGKDELFSTDR